MPREARTRSVELKYADPAAFAAACERTDLHSLVVWNCKVRDFAPLARLTKLKSLTVMDFRGELDVLAGLTGLRRLELVHVRDARSLEPFAALKELRLLSLEARGGNPLTNRVVQVDLLTPLARLCRLEQLTMMRLSVATGGLKPLADLPRLRAFECSNIFPLTELAWLAGRRPRLRGGCVAPTLEMPLPCGRCGMNKVRLNGTGGTDRVRLVCPRCQAERVTAHTAEFERLAMATRQAKPPPHPALRDNPQGGWPRRERRADLPS